MDKPTPSEPYALTGTILLLVVLFAIGVYDAFADLTNNRFATVTSIIVDWSTRWPIIPFIAGIIAGHLFWSRR